MAAGAILFSRYAYPPNALGYCGPGDPAGLLEEAGTFSRTGATTARDRTAAAHGLAERAKGFEGAWPYLQLIAGANRISEPLDPRVVEAYWIGNSLLDNVAAGLLAASVESRFRSRAGRTWGRLAEVLPSDCRPHHSFHVFAIYPWVGLLRAGHVEEPLHVIDQCRVRCGRVEAIHGDSAIVRTLPLRWDGSSLSYGPARLETARFNSDGWGFVRFLRPGEWVSLHWDWICDRLTDRQRQMLVHYTNLSLAAVNRASHPAPAAILS